MPRPERSPYDDSKQWLDNSRLQARSASGGILVANTQVTHAEIIGMRASSVTLIPAQGVGWAIVVRDDAWYVLDKTAGAYTDGGGSPHCRLYLGQQELSNNLGGLNLALTGFITDVVYGDTTQSLIGNTENKPSDPLFTADNQPLLLVNTGDVEFGGGHADNTLSWRIWYSVVPTVPFN